jgi:hypothetical protein
MKSETLLRSNAWTGFVMTDLSELESAQSVRADFLFRPTYSLHWRSDRGATDPVSDSITLIVEAVGISHAMIPACEAQLPVRPAAFELLVKRE